MLNDLRQPSWIEAVESPVDAVVSATALHWLTPEQLAGLYRQIAQVLRPGGILALAALRPQAKLTSHLRKAGF